MFGLSCVQSASDFNFSHFVCYQGNSPSFNENIKQVVCVKVPNSKIKTKRVIQYSKLGIGVASQVAEWHKTSDLSK